MGYLKINQQNLSASKAEEIISLCPFNAISFNGKNLEISSACKMCKICAKKSNGIIEYIEQTVKQIDKSLYNGILVFASIEDNKIHKVTFELIGKAKELAKKINHPVYVVAIGFNIKELAKEFLYYNVDKVFVYDDISLKDFKIDSFANCFCDLINKYKPSSVLVGATNIGRSLAPRVAARLKTGLTADCTVLKMKDNTDLVQIRPAFGGNIMAQIVSPNTRPQFCTVRYKVFEEPQKNDVMQGEIVEMQVTAEMQKSDISILGLEEKPTEIDISEADVIVAVGRGCMNETALNNAKELAELLGGMVACTRPLVENNTFDAKRQIGLSGRTVKPKLIITLGISGSVQFAAGMKSSDRIIAINQDQNAAIFDIAHYCVIGDLNEIVPKIIKKIREDKNV